MGEIIELKPSELPEVPPERIRSIGDQGINEEGRYVLLDDNGSKTSIQFWTPVRRPGSQQKEASCRDL